MYLLQFRFIARKILYEIFFARERGKLYTVRRTRSPWRILILRIKRLTRTGIPGTVTGATVTE